MAKKKTLKSMPKSKVRIFKIANRRGYAALCFQNLTEGTTPYMTYRRMQKAVKRLGVCLPDIEVAAAKALIRKTV